LEQRIPDNSLYPSDTIQNAQAYFWEDWADESLHWFEVYFRFAYPADLDKAAMFLTK